MRRQILLGILLFSLADAASAQIDFSGDIVDLQKPGTPVLCRLSFTKDKRRLDMQPASDEGSIVVRLSAETKEKPAAEVRVGGTGRALILDLDDYSSTILIPDEKTYSKQPGQRLRAAQLYGLYAFTHPSNVDDACPEWMKGQRAEGETCKKVGEEKVNNRSTVKYDLSCYHETCHLWIDRRLRVIVKRETKWNSTELRNIQEIPPDYSLFQVPADYSEGKLNGVIQQSQPQ